MKVRIIILFFVSSLIACQTQDFSTQISNLQASLKASSSATMQTEAIEKFKKAFPDMAALKTQLSGLIEEVKGKIYDESTNRLDPELSADYIEKCDLYAQLLPEDEQSPKLLFQAGETARSARNFSKALQIYDKIYTQYPNYEKAPQALFLKGFTLDNDLKQHDKARVIYEDFLAKFPNDDFADDTQFLLSNLGKSDDEIIKNFE